MTAKPQYTCEECKYDGGIHYSAEGDGPVVASRCPNWQMAKATAEMRDTIDRINSEAREQAKKAAQQIVADAAHTRFRFSANDLDEELEAARIPTSLVGGAFAWARDNGLIKRTDEQVPNRKRSTRSGIWVWESLVYGNRRTA